MTTAIPPSDPTKDYRFTIEMIRELYRPFRLSGYAIIEVDRLLDAYAALPGPFLITRHAALNVFIELQRAFDELRDIMGDDEPASG